MRVTLRLTDEEHEKLLAICKSGVRGDLTPSELLRLLIHREFNRRKSLGKPRGADYDSASRQGRPRLVLVKPSDTSEQ